MDLSYLELEGQGWGIIMEVTRPLLLGQFQQVKWPITPNKSAGSVPSLCQETFLIRHIRGHSNICSSCSHNQLFLVMVDQNSTQQACTNNQFVPNYMHAANYLLAQWVLTAYLISIVIFTDVFSFLSQKLTLEMTMDNYQEVHEMTQHITFNCSV